MPGFHLVQYAKGWKVQDDDGREYSKRVLSEKKAKAQQKALWAAYKRGEFHRGSGFTMYGHGKHHITIYHGAGWFGNVITKIKGLASRAAKSVFNVAAKAVGTQVRVNYPPKVRAVMEKYGSGVVEELLIRRAPIINLVDKALNFISLGKWAEVKQKYAYDKLFHLSMIVALRMPDGAQKRLIVEKNEVINISDKFKTGGEEEYYRVNVPCCITFGTLIGKGKELRGDAFFKYDAFNNNCQDFLISILTANGLLTPENQAFIKQDVGNLLKELPSYISPFANLTTNIAGLADKVLEGEGNVIRGAGKYKDILSRTYKEYEKQFDEALREGDLPRADYYRIMNEMDRDYHLTREAMKAHRLDRVRKLELAAEFNERMKERVRELIDNASDEEENTFTNVNPIRRATTAAAEPDPPVVATEAVDEDPQHIEGMGIKFGKLNWGTFTKTFERFQKKHPGKVASLEQFAHYVLDNAAEFSKITAKRARFYKNIIKKGSGICPSRMACARKDKAAKPGSGVAATKVFDIPELRGKIMGMRPIPFKSDEQRERERELEREYYRGVEAYYRAHRPNPLTGEMETGLLDQIFPPTMPVRPAHLARRDEPMGPMPPRVVQAMLNGMERAAREREASEFQAAAQRAGMNQPAQGRGKCCGGCSKPNHGDCKLRGGCGTCGGAKQYTMPFKDYMEEHRQLIKVLDDIAAKAKGLRDKQASEPAFKKGKGKHSRLAQLVMSTNANKVIKDSLEHSLQNMPRDSPVRPHTRKVHKQVSKMIKEDVAESDRLRETGYGKPQGKGKHTPMAKETMKRNFMKKALGTMAADISRAHQVAAPMPVIEAMVQHYNLGVDEYNRNRASLKSKLKGYGKPPGYMAGFCSPKAKGGVRFSRKSTLTEEQRATRDAQLAEQRRAQQADMAANPLKYEPKSYDPTDGGRLQPCWIRRALDRPEGGLSFGHRTSLGMKEPSECEALQQAQIAESDRRQYNSMSPFQKFAKGFVDVATKVADFAVKPLELIPGVGRIASQVYQNFAPPGSEYYGDNLIKGVQAMAGEGKPSSRFMKQLAKLKISPATYLAAARAAGKRHGYKPSEIDFAGDGEHKLVAGGTPFGRVGYGDFIIYTLTGNPIAERKRSTFHKSHSKIKGDWEGKKYSANNLALRVLW